MSTLKQTLGAVYRQDTDLKAIRELLRYGADPALKNRHGIAPRDLARETDRKDIEALFNERPVGV